MSCTSATTQGTWPFEGVVKKETELGPQLILFLIYIFYRKKIYFIRNDCKKELQKLGGKISSVNAITEMENKTRKMNRNPHIAPVLNVKFLHICMISLPLRGCFLTWITDPV